MSPEGYLLSPELRCTNKTNIELTINYKYTEYPRNVCSSLMDLKNLYFQAIIW